MEGHGVDFLQDHDLFFALGAGPDFPKVLGKTAVRASMRGIGTVEYLENKPIRAFLDIIEEIVRIDNQRKKK